MVLFSICFLPLTIVYYYVSPSQDHLELNVKVENKGESAAKIVRLWINDDPVPLDYTVQPMSGQNDLGTYPVSPVEGSSYFVTVTTDMGNSVAFDTPLTWVDEFTGWETDVFFGERPRLIPPGTGV